MVGPGGPRVAVFFLGAAAVCIAGLACSETRSWLALGAWLIYIRGIVVIFLFFLAGAPNEGGYSDLPTPWVGGGLGLVAVLRLVEIQGPRAGGVLSNLAGMGGAG